MPLYEFYCSSCQKETTVAQSMQEHDRGATCPGCGQKLEPRLGSFFAKTSRKS